MIFVCGRLASLGVDSMVTGSVASGLQGEPRASHLAYIGRWLPVLGVADLWQEIQTSISDGEKGSA
ncbi:MAG: hypothetical protein U0793_26350 [Gemmataceae bacterium]